MTQSSAVSWATTRYRLRAWSRSIALPFYVASASPDPSLLVTSAVSHMNSLARARYAPSRGIPARIASEVCAAASASFAWDRRLRFESAASMHFPRRVFLLRSRRCLRFGARFGPWMGWRESDRRLPGVPEVLCSHRFRH